MIAIVQAYEEKGRGAKGVLLAGSMAERVRMNFLIECDEEGLQEFLRCYLAKENIFGERVVNVIVRDPAREKLIAILMQEGVVEK